MIIQKLQCKAILTGTWLQWLPSCLQRHWLVSPKITNKKVLGMLYIKSRTPQFTGSRNILSSNCPVLALYWKVSKKFLNLLPRLFYTQCALRWIATLSGKVILFFVASLVNMSQLWKERICSSRSKYFLYIVDLILENLLYLQKLKVMKVVYVCKNARKKKGCPGITCQTRCLL